MRAELLRTIVAGLERQFHGIRVFDRAVDESQVSASKQCLMVVFQSSENEQRPGQREHERLQLVVRAIMRGGDGYEFQKWIAQIEDCLYDLYDAVNAMERNDTAQWHDWSQQGVTYASTPDKSYDMADIRWLARYDYLRGSASGE